MSNWLRDLSRLRQAGKAAVLVTVAGVRGSAPREVGAKMLVTADEAFGTIGGGALEYQCTRLAAERLQCGDAAGFLRRFPLGSNCGQCCGGVVDILFEPVAGMSCIDALLAAWSGRQDALLLTTLNDAGCPIKFVLDANGKRLTSAIDAQHASVDSSPTLAGREAATTHQDYIKAASRNAERPRKDRQEPSADMVRQALALLARGATAERSDTPGRQDRFLLLESVTDSGFEIAVFGAGHVGSALVQLLAGLDCRLRWIDSRRAVFPAACPANVQCIESSDPARDVTALPAAAYYFVMTHSHALDLDICAAILRRGDFAYCGLIGSATKRKRFEVRLRELGIKQGMLQQLTCPIGVRGIAGKKPQEIAIAAAAEVLQHHEQQRAAQRHDDAQLFTLKAQ